MSGLAVVFDLDGTLIDSAPDLHRAANVALAGEGAAPLTLEEVRSFIGNGVAVLVARAMAARGLAGEATHARMLAAFTADYGRAPVALTRPYPGVVSALRSLASSGARLGVCTNKPEAPARAILAALGLVDFFAVVIGGDSLTVRKPDPAPLRAAFDGLGVSGGVYVGDSEVDAETAQAAGVPFLIFTEGYRKTALAQLPHTAAFADWSRLPALVRTVAGTTL